MLFYENNLLRDVDYTHSAMKTFISLCYSLYPNITSVQRNNIHRVGINYINIFLLIVEYD